MKIVILDANAVNPGDLSWDWLDGCGEVTMYERSQSETTEEVCRRISGADIVLTNKTEISREIMESDPALKYIGELATGYNGIDIEAAKELGIVVTNIPAYSTMSVAQHTFALILELTNHVAHHSRRVHEGAWVVCKDFCFWDKQLVELDGKVLGIIGFGRIGSAVARIAKAFGMKILVSDAHPGREEDRAAVEAKLVSLDELYAQSDVITLHCPLTPETERMINLESIEKMKDTAILINTSRGPVIDEDDLAFALMRGKLGAAALDVVKQEPMSAYSPLLVAPNCIITPHIAWAPVEARERLMKIAEENIKAFLAGDPINVVNK